MARERYLLDDTEDTIHKNEIKPQTAADKRKNWWDYHKVHVLLVALAISISCRNMNLLSLAHGHLVHRCIKAGDHHARHAGELQGFAALDRRVEHCTVIKRSNIVNAYLFSFVAHIVSFHEENRIISADPFARFLFVRVV